jgi:hypothetical protein
MKLFTRLFPLFLVVLLTACATVEPLPKETVAQLKRVGVVSHTGDSLYKQYIGVTVFGNERDLQDITDWKLDETYSEQVAAAVKVVFKAEPLVLAQYRREFAEVNSLNGPWAAPAFWGPNFNKIGEVTRRACSEQNLDAVIVVSRWQSEDILGATNQKVEGVGVYARRGMAMAHVLSKVGFMDCKSGKPLTVARVMKAATPPNDAFQKRLVTAPVDPQVAAKPFSTWSQAEKNGLRALLSALPKEAWGSTLRAMIPTQ